AYMAPEQAIGAPVDLRADLYSLAVIVYRCLTGRPAFAGAHIPNILHAVVHDMPLRPSEIVPLPRDIDAVLAIAMAKQSEDRFARVDDFARHLADAARGQLSPELRSRAAALLERQPWRQG
ncbi:MAG: serine/threonine protein kinase, partial [Myxococcota bacterium]